MQDVQRELAPGCGMLFIHVPVSRNKSTFEKVRRVAGAHMCEGHRSGKRRGKATAARRRGSGSSSAQVVRLVVIFLPYYGQPQDLFVRLNSASLVFGQQPRVYCPRMAGVGIKTRLRTNECGPALFFPGHGRAQLLQTRIKKIYVAYIASKVCSPVRGARDDSTSLPNVAF